MEVRLPEVRKLSVAAASSSSCVMITLCVIQEDLWQCAELSYGVSSMSACCGREGRIFNLKEKQKMFPSPTPRTQIYHRVRPLSHYRE